MKYLALIPRALKWLLMRLPALWKLLRRVSDDCEIRITEVTNAPADRTIVRKAEVTIRVDRPLDAAEIATLVETATGGSLLTVNVSAIEKSINNFKQK